MDDTLTIRVPMTPERRAALAERLLLCAPLAGAAGAFEIGRVQ